MQMTSTLWGMEQYFQLKHQSLFDDIVLPAGVNKQTLVNTILVEAGEFEVLYPDGDFLRIAINTWFERKYNMLDRWIKAVNTEYKPLENYNRTEKWTDKATGTTSNNGSRNYQTDSSGNDSGTDTNNETVGNTSSSSTVVGAQTTTDETKVSAFNESTYSPSQKDESNIGGRTDSDSGTSTTTTEGTLSRNNSFSNTSTTVGTTSDNGTTNNNSEHTGEVYGNIGVTTSQQMLESEMKLWGKIDIYRDTAEMFVEDFCIMIY